MFGTIMALIGTCPLRVFRFTSTTSTHLTVGDVAPNVDRVICSFEYSVGKTCNCCTAAVVMNDLEAPSSKRIPKSTVLHWELTAAYAVFSSTGLCVGVNVA